MRAEELAGRREAHLRALAGAEFRTATAALADFESRWRHGGSPVLRRLVDAGVVELLGGPATADAWMVGDSDVVAFGRDLDVTYRAWAPRSGYPGGRWYRDFHTFDHPSGFRPARVTSRRTP